jgi:hypothetical protein
MAQKVPFSYLHQPTQPAGHHAFVHTALCSAKKRKRRPVLLSFLLEK